MAAPGRTLLPGSPVTPPPLPASNHSSLATPQELKEMQTAPPEISAGPVGDDCECGGLAVGGLLVGVDSPSPATSSSRPLIFQCTSGQQPLQGRLVMMARGACGCQ